MPLKFDLNKLFAVHSTSVLPQHGKMIPGFSTFIPTKEDPMQVPNFRCTLHWCLGGMVPPEFFSYLGGVDSESLDSESIDSKAREDAKSRPYAIVTPLKNLIPQLANIFMSDTFIIGPYQLSSEDFILIPHGVNDPGLVASGVRIKYYDPKHISLSDAVQELITAQGGWCIQQYPPKTIEDRWLFHTATLVDAPTENINTLLFFKEFLTKYPDVSFGTHEHALTRSKISEITMDWDELFLVFDGILGTSCVEECDFSDDQEQKSLIIFLLYVFEFKLKALLDWIHTSHLPAHAKDAAFDFLRSQAAWFDLLVLEAKLAYQNQSLIMVLGNNEELCAGLVEQLRYGLQDAEKYLAQYKHCLRDLKANPDLDFRFNPATMQDTMHLARHIPRDQLFNGTNVDDAKVTRLLKECVQQLELDRPEFTYSRLLDRHLAHSATKRAALAQS